MKKLLTILLTLFLFSSAYAEVRVVDKLEYRDGVAYAVGESEGFSGTWVNVGTNGNKASELNYKDGLQDGLTTKWFPNGAKGEEANYKNGKLHGTTTEWNTNGAIESKTNYKDGKLHGTATEWHTNGAIESKTNYINGKGKKLYEASFDWNGEVREVSEYVDGKPSKSVVYHRDGVKQVDEHVDGKLSKSVFYHRDGDIEKVREYPDIGRMDFKSTHYHKTGEVKKVEEYVNNRISKEISHHKTGEVKMVKEYVDGLKSKITHYHKTGELEKAYKFVGNKTLIKTSDSDEWLLIADQQIIKANNNNIKQILLDEIRRLGSDADLNHIDVSNVTDMRALFLHSPFSGDISKWNVSNVTNMHRMFIYSKFNGDISKWDVSNVKATGNIFDYSNGNIPKWAEQLKLKLPENPPITFYYLFLTLLYSAPLLALYIYYFRNRPNTPKTYDRKFIWGVTILYIMTWIYSVLTHIPYSSLSNWDFVHTFVVTPLFVGAWVLYGIVSIYRDFKK